LPIGGAAIASWKCDTLTSHLHHRQPPLRPPFSDEKMSKERHCTVHMNIHGIISCR
jgi:hypothetical protein